MDKKVLGLLGAVSALALAAGIEAARAQDAARVMNPQSYAELLQPIQDAASLLLVVDQIPPKDSLRKDVQWHHHNHSHHHWGGGWHHSHHHWHSHNFYPWWMHRRHHRHWDDDEE